MEYDQITCVLGEWQVFVRSGYCSAPSLLDFFLPVNSYVTYPKIVCILLRKNTIENSQHFYFISCQTEVKKKLCV